MLCVVSDTHGTDGHRLDGRTLEAVREAEAVIHAGDFTTESALDAFESASRELYAVHGNNATPAVRDRLPAERTVEHEGVRIALTHGDDRNDTGLELFGRQAQAHLVVFGHSHRSEFIDTGEIGLLNPGSHADPRWYRPAHVELDVGEDHLDGRLCDPDGEVFEEFRVHIA
jgi:putative phosphoesterase